MGSGDANAGCRAHRLQQIVGKGVKGRIEHGHRRADRLQAGMRIAENRADRHG